MLIAVLKALLDADERLSASVVPDLLYSLAAGTDVLVVPAWAQQEEILFPERAYLIQGGLEAVLCPGAAQRAPASSA